MKNGSKYSTTKSKTNYNYKKSTRNHNILFMIPLIIVISVLPLIMQYTTYKTNLDQFNWFPDREYGTDIFLKVKQSLFIFMSSIMLLLAGFKYYRTKKNIKLLPLFIPITIYGILAILSTVLSDHSSFGYSGIYAQFESLFALLGYCIVIFYAYLFIENEEDVKLLIRVLIISVLILGFIGFLQVIGHDFFRSNLGKKLILPKALWNQTDEFDYRFDAKTIYLTLSNPNYVGVYTALISPILISLFITIKDIKIRIITVIALTGLAISLYGSGSAAGVIGTLISIAFILLLHRKYIFKKKWITICFTAIVIGASIFLLIFKFNQVKQKIDSFFNLEKTEYTLTDIKTEDEVIITYKGNIMKCSLDVGESNLSFNIHDVNNQPIEYTVIEETGALKIIDERFLNFILTPVKYNELVSLNINIDGTDWIFSNQLGDDTYYYINEYGKAIKIVSADSAIFTGYEKLATGRGYIWSRTIPLLKDKIVLGSGADTFSLVFPQNDYVNKYNAGFSGQLMTKPHSMYLQIAVQTGLLSLVALLVFYMMYFCSSFGLYIKGNFDDTFSKVGVGIFIGTIAFMVTAITNDSSITVTPVFFALIGVGIAINSKVKQSRLQSEK